MDFGHPSCSCCAVVPKYIAKKLSQTMTPEMVSLARFLFGIPIVTTGYLVGRQLFGYVEVTSMQFFIWIILFSVSQITANALLVSLFHQKNFAVSITYVKTEAIFTAILAIVFLSEKLSLVGWAGVLIAFTGLVLTTFSKEKIGIKTLQKSLHQKSSYVGIMSGFLFAIAVISIKISFSFLESDYIVMKSIFALFISLFAQSAMLLVYLALTKRGEVLALIRKPLIPFLTGTFSGVGSFMWFTAFAITYVVYVKTLGQIEFVLGILVSVYFFKEEIYRNEILGMGLMAFGTVVLIFA